MSKFLMIVASANLLASIIFLPMGEIQLHRDYLMIGLLIFIAAQSVPK